jgi:hypothetical protein
VTVEEATMTWTSDQLQVLERENARIGFQPGDQLPASAHAELGAPEGYLALLATVPDGGGMAGYIEALTRYTAARPAPTGAT